MFSVDDLMDLCIDTLTRRVDDPIPYPLFDTVTVSDRIATGIGSECPGVEQAIYVKGVGKYAIEIREV